MDVPLVDLTCSWHRTHPSVGFIAIAIVIAIVIAIDQGNAVTNRTTQKKFTTETLQQATNQPIILPTVDIYC